MEAGEWGEGREIAQSWFNGGVDLMGLSLITPIVYEHENRCWRDSVVKSDTAVEQKQNEFCEHYVIAINSCTKTTLSFTTDRG